jgi:hypothetical protein
MSKATVCKRVVQFSRAFNDNGLTSTQQFLEMGDYMFHMAIPCLVQHGPAAFDAMLKSQCDGVVYPHMSDDANHTIITLWRAAISALRPPKVVARVVSSNALPKDASMCLCISDVLAQSPAHYPVVCVRNGMDAETLRERFDELLVEKEEDGPKWSWLLKRDGGKTNVADRTNDVIVEAARARYHGVTVRLFLSLVWRHGVWAMDDVSKLRRVLSDAYDFMWTNGPDALDMVFSDMMYQSGSYREHTANGGYALTRLTNELMIGNWRHVIRIDASELGPKHQWWWSSRSHVASQHSVAMFMSETKDVALYPMPETPETPQFIVVLV